LSSKLGLGAHQEGHWATFRLSFLLGHVEPRFEHFKRRLDAQLKAADPRGLAIKFRLPDGSDTDLVTPFVQRLSSEEPEEFQQSFLAVAGNKPGVPPSTPIEAFQETHLAAKAFLTTRIRRQ
jgi:hypothetical protein